MKFHEVLACSFSSWYPSFKKITFPSSIIPLSRAYVEQLLADNVVLGSNQTLISCDQVNDSDNTENDSNEWGKVESEAAALEAPIFEEFDTCLKSAISKLGGNVFIKLNWSSPKDAAWIALNSSLKCVMPADIHLLLQSSDFIAHDLTQPFKDCSDKDDAPVSIDYELILRKWIEINPAHEFRCFVRGKTLIGVCQRDSTQYYPHIQEEKSDILRDIMSFHDEYILAEFSLDNYILDVVRSRKDEVILVDINPFGITTDSLLFDWQESPLRSIIDPELSSNDTAPEFRYLKEDSGVRTNPLRQYGIPLDFVHLTSGEDPYKLIDLLNLRSQHY